MSDIVLATLNAKYIHSAFGLRYLLANLGPLREHACLLEFDISQRPVDIAEALLAHSPKILGLGVYIWNVTPSTELVSILKRLKPELRIVLGGPEVSYETDDQPIVKLADYVITGEGDLAFRQLCGELLSGQTASPHLIPAPLPDFSELTLPYDLYSEQDIAHRILYVEASRGCPFSCEFCLSSLDIPVRQAPLESFLKHLQQLLDKGAKQLKFIDRTFNLNTGTSRAILEFLLQRWRSGCFFHFEMVPDRLPVELREIIVKFPPGALQFEVGIQTFNTEVADRIKRRQNYSRMEENFRFLKTCTGMHIHADLIAGLPGESLESFAAGFDRLVRLGPHEIQVGILKRLRGTSIVRHDNEWLMVYNPLPPYEILSNKLLDFAAIQKLRRFARYWDMVGNSGNFVETTPLIWIGDGSNAANQLSPFTGFLRFSEWLFKQIGRTEGVALVRLMRLIFEYLTNELRMDPARAAAALWADYKRGGRYDKPTFLREYLPFEPETLALIPREPSTLLPKRQARHARRPGNELTRETASEDNQSSPEPQGT